jgi:uncharacterized cupin superfamily protein
VPLSNALVSTLVVWLALSATQATSVVLDNPYVRVNRDAAPCATASPTCVERVIVALGATELRSNGSARKLARGQIAAFAEGQSYTVPTGGPYVEVAFKPKRPPVQSPKEMIAPDKNAIVHDAERFFVFEERLEPGDTRARHSHSQRVVVQLNKTRLQQWPDGEAELVRDIVPDGVAFNAPVIHVVKNVGELPLRGIVIELKPERQ